MYRLVSFLTGAFLRLLNSFLRFLCQFVESECHLFPFHTPAKKGQRDRQDAVLIIRRHFLGVYRGRYRTAPIVRFLPEVLDSGCLCNLILY
jgi:hypothetical protein